MPAAVPHVTSLFSVPHSARVTLQQAPAGLLPSAFSFLLSSHPSVLLCPVPDSLALSRDFPIFNTWLLTQNFPASALVPASIGRPLTTNSVSSEGSDPCMHPHAMKTSPAGKLAMGREHPRVAGASVPLSQALMQEVCRRKLSSGVSPSLGREPYKGSFPSQYLIYARIFADADASLPPPTWHHSQNATSSNATSYTMLPLMRFLLSHLNASPVLL